MINTVTQAIQEVLNASSDSGTNIGVGIGAGICMVGAMGCGIGEGIAASKACEAVARNPEAENKIRTMMVIGCAISETSGIYGLIIALLLIFVA
ncbi:MAG: ATP synthase F0 subunit C [Mycoplasmataceae bacterium]|jgi:F-type H+-transporting ATPase subunit c|nr:ATP synthase F0 subunit C [Mycoplasmataceae bacterium]